MLTSAVTSLLLVGYLHFRASDFNSVGDALKCSKASRALKFIGGDQISPKGTPNP